jgi:hypothetical protein
MPYIRIQDSGVRQFTYYGTTCRLALLPFTAPTKIYKTFTPRASDRVARKAKAHRTSSPNLVMSAAVEFLPTQYLSSTACFRLLAPYVIQRRALWADLIFHSRGGGGMHGCGPLCGRKIENELEILIRAGLVSLYTPRDFQR